MNLSNKNNNKSKIPKHRHIQNRKNPSKTSPKTRKNAIRAHGRQAFAPRPTSHSRVSTRDSCAPPDCAPPAPPARRQPPQRAPPGPAPPKRAYYVRRAPTHARHSRVCARRAVRVCACVVHLFLGNV